jgi:hypothetical protein
MTNHEKPNEATLLNVEAGDRAVNAISVVLGVVAVAGLAEAIFDFSEDISNSAAFAFTALSAGSAYFMRYVNQRDRGDGSAS